MIAVKHCKILYYFYTINEAKERNIKYLNNWRDGKVGDWVLSDNGYVCQVLKRYEWKDPNGYLCIALVFANGSFTASWKNAKFIASEKKSTSLSGKEARKGSSYDKQVDLLLDMAIRTNFNWDAAYQLAFANKKSKITLRRVLSYILNSDLYKRKFMEKLDSKLDSGGLGIDELLQNLKRHIDNKDDNKISFEALKCAFNLRGIDITKAHTDGKNKELPPSNDLKEITGKTEEATFKELPENTKKYINGN